MINHQEVIDLTREYGGQWALCHAQRILDNIALIADSQAYDPEPLWIAAHLHDWGGYAKWALPGVDHAARSRQVAEQFLAERSCPQAPAARILECIEFHHGGPADRSVESVLFANADALDLLGTVGVLRVFAMNYRDLRGAVAACRRYRDVSDRAITLGAARRIADVRIAELNRLLEQFELQTGGVY